MFECHLKTIVADDALPTGSAVVDCGDMGAQRDWKRLPKFATTQT